MKLDEKPKDEILAERGESEGNDRETPSDGQEGDLLGLEIRTLTPEIAERSGLEESRGVLVTSVVPGSRAMEAGLRPDDVILEVNKTPVTTVDQFRKAVGKPSPGESVVLRVLRDSNYLFVMIDM
jgi:serine protease Do